MIKLPSKMILLRCMRRLQIFTSFSTTKKVSELILIIQFIGHITPIQSTANEKYIYIYIYMY